MGAVVVAATAADDEGTEALLAGELATRGPLRGANALEQLTGRELAFWARSFLKQAKELAVKNRAEARGLLRAAKGSRLEKAEKTFATLERTSCDDLHFEMHPSMAPAAVR